MTNSKGLCKGAKRLPRSISGPLDFGLEGSRFCVVPGLAARTEEPNLETPQNVMSRRLPETSPDMATANVVLNRATPRVNSRQQPFPGAACKKWFPSGYSLSAKSARSSRYGRKRLPSGSPGLPSVHLTSTSSLCFLTRLGCRPLLFDQF
jgi:hypothetical protein